MNSKLFTLGLLIGFVVVTPLAAGQLSPAPTFQPQLKVGDNVTIAVANARLMNGAEEVAALAPGQPAVVVDVREPWIGVHVSVAGQLQSGWLRMADFVPVAPPAPVLATGSACPTGPTAYTAAYAPQQAAALQPLLAAGPVYAERQRSDPFLTGYYDRHEPDPNMHVWEPWRR